MTGQILRFPLRRSASVWIIREGAAWLVLARGQAWLHGSHRAALADARWLAQNLGLPIRRAPA
jgi:hypothetical protein